MLKKWLLPVITFLFFLFTFDVAAQQLTKIKGVVLDANTKEPLPFVNVSFKGANIGTTTDFSGNFYLETQWATGELQASFIGYKTIIKKSINR